MSETACGLAIGCSRGTVRRIEAGETGMYKWMPRAALPQTWTTGEELHMLRKRAELTARELGTLLDVGRDMVYRIERNEVSINEPEMRSIELSLEYATRL